MVSQVISGSGQGAQAGYSASGSWQGAVVGAVIGGIGGLFGDKAAKYRRRAAKEEAKMAERTQAIQRRDIVRSLYLARGEALAASAAQESGGLQSSAAQGALSSISTQGTFNVKFFDTQITSQMIRNRYLKKAGKQQEYSDFIMGAIQSINGSGGGGGGGGGMMGGMGGSGGGMGSWGGQAASAGVS